MTGPLTDAQLSFHIGSLRHAVALIRCSAAGDLAAVPVILAAVRDPYHLAATLAGICVGISMRAGLSADDLGAVLDECRTDVTDLFLDQGRQAAGSGDA